MSAQRILYVEDFEPAAITMKYIAEELGYECVCAPTAAEALELISDGEYALILVDVNLPDMDGDVLAGKMRENSAAPIIGFTGEPAMVSKERAQAFDGLEQKHFDLDDIKKTLQFYLDGHRKP